MARQGFVIYYKDFDDADALPDADFRALLRALRRYSETGEITPLDGSAAMAFSFMRRSDDCDRERYEKRVNSGRGAANSRWGKAKDNTNACERMPSNESYATDSIPKPIPTPKPTPNMKPNMGNEGTGDANAPPPPKKSPRFTKPTIAEVRAYCVERKNAVDAARWYDYYESNGWRVGKNPMKDWKAAVRTWERGDNNGRPNAAHGRSSDRIGDDKPDLLGSWDIAGRTIV